ncbi:MULTISPECIES: S-methyl-5-thioribose-1-phosphate isomerase [unclassified Beijerinckia]|uniref:S-methyl-5-thioribose-1-phosphate isomerase n=1 Tax=unclassified Beijerinckia TaxID=2638183 RepID=UPI00089B21AF|nr:MULTISPECIES: S-methyl-5-thioribose-1-phosphate isomerase [unclassified Beijerinckia]MDH7799472.1 methylthioribose-1-phosphate isomerase [Beijerinckia sp. GAS462]SED51657.1 methylthioribose-1-phosphate isomerase [Beijerinckia sp. 28-YEA-48]
MQIGGRHYRTIWEDERRNVVVIDQTKLPFALETLTLKTSADAARAIKDMIVRGAPLIGATAAWGVALAMRDDPSDAALAYALASLGATRPTAVNLHWALRRMQSVLLPLPPEQRAASARIEAINLCDEDATTCRAIGEQGLPLLRQAAARKDGATLNILTHCNAGWLACVDYGTALAPIYLAHDSGIDVHVWVDETRPRNQGASLTAYELGAHGIKHTVIADNAGGHLMQHGEVDLCIVGSDRTTAQGDVANKIGTYLKALAAFDNHVPFYVALPFSTIDWSLGDGINEIPIEERAAGEVTDMTGIDADGTRRTIRIVAPGSNAANPAFDVTPARLVTALITERGVTPATAAGLAALYPQAERV